MTTKFDPSELAQALREALADPGFRRKVRDELASKLAVTRTLELLDSDTSGQLGTHTATSIDARRQWLLAGSRRGVASRTAPNLFDEILRDLHAAAREADNKEQRRCGRAAVRKLKHHLATVSVATRRPPGGRALQLDLDLWDAVFLSFEHASAAASPLLQTLKFTRRLYELLLRDLSPDFTEEAEKRVALGKSATERRELLRQAMGITMVARPALHVLHVGLEGLAINPEPEAQAFIDSLSGSRGAQPSSQDATDFVLARLHDPDGNSGPDAVRRAERKRERPLWVTSEAHGLERLTEVRPAPNAPPSQTRRP